MNLKNTVYSLLSLSLLFFVMLASLWMIFLVAPTEATMGDIQRIFYFHVASGWISFLAFFVVFVGSILFLLTRKNAFDRIALASAELGILFSTLVLITGPLWAKPVWGIWWTWDARLTSSFVLWLIYISYLMLRAFVHPEHKKQILSAVLGILGFVDVPIVYLSIRWWRTQHPSPVIGGGEGSGIDPLMFKTLMISCLAFFILYIVLIKIRISLLKAEEDIQKIQNHFES